MKKINEKKMRLGITVVVLTVLFLCSCTSNKDAADDEAGTAVVETSENGIEATDDVRAYIENRYGFADDSVNGINIAHTEFSTGTQTTTYQEKIADDSDEGAVFYKTVSPDGKNKGLVCVYLTDNEDKKISLNAEYIYDYTAPSGSYTIPLANPEMKKRCYAIINDHCLVSINISEKEDIARSDISENAMCFKEEISVYELTGSSAEKLFSIERELESGENGTKDFKISEGSKRIIYAAGYSSYTAEGAEFVSTQHEFCDLTNNLLSDNSIDCVTLNATSWSNRWYGMEIDEGGINSDMVKVDFSFSDEFTDENGDKNTNIVMTINDIKDQSDEKKQLEEIDDSPVAYGNETENDPVNEIVIPENIPASINVDELQDLAYFDIDGFWHSTDNKYVYCIYTQHPDNGFGTLYFADLDGKAKAKHGQVKQTSSYSVILKAMESDEFSPEVYAVNGQLISDELTLVKVNSSIASALLGTWSDGETTYSFDNDGTYHVKESGDSYWGKYFIIDESNIVLGEQLEDLEMEQYSIEGGTLTIDSCSLKRQ